MAQSKQQAIKSAYNSTKLALNAADQGAATTPYVAAHLDADQILKRVIVSGKVRTVNV